jgi:dTDP-4-amino-4,6-dideoxygalactose transaminase
MIAVTQTFLPPIEEYQAVLKRAWDAKWITNRGSLTLELEEKLKSHLNLPFLTLTTNGTLPLQISLKALGLEGEIITTPFSYVATVSSIVWENCKPVFVDIHPSHLTIDETKIEAAITSKTTAILATHVFGNPCDVEAIEALAKKYGLKVIYDAAHSFGVNYKGKSVFAYGDVSTCSFHATKIFHTGEGGCMVSQNQELHDKLFYHHNFGHDGPLAFQGLGINAKMSELQAAMGLSVFPYFTEILAQRKRCVELYISLLKDAPLSFLEIRANTEWNYSYFPVLFPSETFLLKTIEALASENIFPRRYFYPSLNHLPYVDKQDMPVSESTSRRIACLPLFHSLENSAIEQICTIIKNTVL